MKSSARDKVEGKMHEAKGKVKELVGKAVGNPNLEARGKAEHASGKVQEKRGEIKDVLGK